jgi:hypothetical protein
MKPDSYQKNVYLGGIIGKQMSQMTLISQVFNNGNLDLYVNQAMFARVNGYGYMAYNSLIADQEFDLLSITNSGRIRTLYSTGLTLNQTDMANMDIEVSGVYAASGVSATFTGLFNNGDLIIDLAATKKVAGVLILENQTKSSLIHAYQTGTLNLTTMQSLNRVNTEVAGLSLGDNISYDHLRNEGNINVTFDHQNNTAGTLKVSGVFNNLSNNQTATNLFNGGNLSITQGLASSISLDLYLSGINQLHTNQAYYTANNINYQSVNRLDEKNGSMHNLLNDGDLTILGSFNGSSYISGITIINSGLLTQAINLGNIKNQNQTTKTGGIVASAGLS